MAWQQKLRSLTAPRGILQGHQGRWPPFSLLWLATWKKMPSKILPATTIQPTNRWSSPQGFCWTKRFNQWFWRFLDELDNPNISEFLQNIGNLFKNVLYMNISLLLPPDWPLQATFNRTSLGGLLLQSPCRLYRIRNTIAISTELKHRWASYRLRLQGFT